MKKMPLSQNTGSSRYDWQEECIHRWFDTGHRGTAKVVTGGGKTLLGLAIAERLQNTVNPRLRVAVVVPTVVLMHQWYDELLERGNVVVLKFSAVSTPLKSLRLGVNWTELQRVVSWDNRSSPFIDV